MTRENIREQTMQMIFQMENSGDFDYTHLLPIEENKKALTKKQALTTLEFIKNHIADIDKCLVENLDNWSIDRVAKSDLAILRTAITEILFMDDIPVSVSINEAVELAKKYGDDKSYKFVNSVLSKIANK